METSRCSNFKKFWIFTAICTVVSLAASLIAMAVTRSCDRHTEVEYF